MKEKLLSPKLNVSIFALAYLSIAVYVLLGSLTPVSNWDTFFHLEFGEKFTHGWTLVDHDVRGYGSAEWIPTQWLSQIFMASIYDNFGWTGIHVVFFIVYMGIIAAAFYIFAKRNNLMLAAGLGIAYTLAINDWLVARPVVFSFAFALAGIAIACKALERPKLAFLFVPLFYFWIMVHGAWITFLPVPFILALGALMNKDFTKAKVFGLASIATVAGTFLTPTLAGAWKAVFVINGKSGDYSEFQRLAFSDPLMMLGLALAIFAFYSIAKKNLDFILLGLASFGFLLMLYNGRTFAFGLLLVLTVITSEPTKVALKISMGTLSALFVIIVTTFVVIAPSLGVAKPLSHQMDAKLAALPAHTNIYSSDFVGSYLLFKYQNLDPIAHGYVDVYTEQEDENLTTLFQLDQGWQEVLAEAKVEYALVPANSVEARAFASENWTVVLNDGQGLLLKRP